MILLFLACGPALTPLTIKDSTLRVELADDGEKRALGLMYRDTLPADQGMLFVYDEEGERSFWMKNTRIPLSAAFISADGTIIRIADMNPLDTRTTDSTGPARYALETNQGWFKQHHVVEGDKVSGLPTSSR